MSVTLLSHPVDSETPSYGNRDKVVLKPQNSISEGDTANTTEIHLTNNHIGTHVDVPKHFYDEGKTITDIAPESWIFESVSLVDIPCGEAKLIDIDDLEGINIEDSTEFLIIRTGYEQKRLEKTYWNSYPGISPELCNFLRSNYPGLKAVGFDFISLTSPKFKEEGKAAHRVLLEERNDQFVFIIEDMKLSHLQKSPERIIVSPLYLQEGNGGPVTVWAFLN